MKVSEAKVLVTGGSSGIGFVTARELKARGAEVAICGRSREKLERAAGSIGAIAIHADVSVEKDVERMVKQVISALGDYNVLVNNAGSALSLRSSIPRSRRCGAFMRRTSSALCSSRASRRGISSSVAAARS
jgi:NAD(P)-dependent dehydrogenase (short-subunit alcohol dehydrogenase family)